MAPSRRLRHLVEYVVFRVVVCLVEALPVRTSVRLAETLAFVFHRLLPRKLTRYDVARNNLRDAFGDRYSDEQIDAIIRGMWEHLFRMIVEIIQLRRQMKLYTYADHVVFYNRSQSLRALCTGRPVILLSGHFGNWELAVSAFGLFGFPMGVVARDLDNPWLHEWFCRFRQSTGHRLISKKGGGSRMLEFLEHRGHIALLGDQDAGSRGLFVDFFGKPASTFKSIALLALQHRALICVGYARRLPDDFRRHRWSRFEIGCEEVIDPLEIGAEDPVREITQRYTAALERLVRRAPQQYFWVHRRWKSVPAHRKRRKAA